MKTHPFIERLKKSLAAALSLALVTTSSGLSDAAAPSVPQPLYAQLSPSPRWGYLVDHFEAPAGPVVVLIQDLHANEGVQKHIASLLDFLCQKLNPSGTGPLPFALAVEGASGPIDSSVLATFPDLNIKRRAANYLLKQGELSGAEYFAAMRGLPTALTGVEEPAYFTLHRDLFRTTYPQRERTVRRLRGMRHDLDELKKKAYPPALRLFERRLRRFENGTLALTDLLALLEKEGRQLGLDLGGLRTSSAPEFNGHLASVCYLIKLEMARRAPNNASLALDLLQVDHDLALLLKVADLQATEQEVKTLGPRVPQFIALASGLLAKAGQPNDQQVSDLRTLISSSIDYYALAMMRNGPIVEHTLSLLDKGKKTSGPPRPRVAVLVAGGFHTRPITQLLRERQVSYVVLSPAVDEITPAQHALYVQRLNGILLTEADVVADRAALQPPLPWWKNIREHVVARFRPGSSGEPHALAAGVGIISASVLLTTLAVSAYGVPDISRLLHEFPSYAAHLPDQNIKALLSAISLAGAGMAILRPGSSDHEPTADEKTLFLNSVMGGPSNERARSIWINAERLNLSSQITKWFAEETSRLSPEALARALDVALQDAPLEAVRAAVTPDKPLKLKRSSADSPQHGMIPPMPNPGDATHAKSAVDAHVERYRSTLMDVLQNLRLMAKMTDSEMRTLFQNAFQSGIVELIDTAATIVSMVDQHRTSLSGSGREYDIFHRNFERYYRNVAGGTLSDDQNRLLEETFIWLAESFDVADQPAVLDALRTPVALMGLMPFTEELIMIADAIFQQGIFGDRWGQRLDAEFRAHGHLFTNVGGQRQKLRVVGEDHPNNIVISNGFSEAQFQALAAHERAHEFIDLLDPSFAEEMSGSSTGVADWFTMAFEMLALSRHHGMDDIVQREPTHIGDLYAQAFPRLLALPDPNNSDVLTAQMEQVVDRVIADISRSEKISDENRTYSAMEKHRFYIEGAAFGAQALRAATRIAATNGRGEDIPYIYGLAGRYVVAGARGGAYQTYAEAVHRSEAAFPSLVAGMAGPNPSPSKNRASGHTNGTIQSGVIALGLVGTGLSSLFNSPALAVVIGIASLGALGWMMWTKLRTPATTVPAPRLPPPEDEAFAAASPIEQGNSPLIPLSVPEAIAHVHTLKELDGRYFVSRSLAGSDDQMMELRSMTQSELIAAIQSGEVLVGRVRGTSGIQVIQASPREPPSLPLPTPAEQRIFTRVPTEPPAPTIPRESPSIQELDIQEALQTVDRLPDSPLGHLVVPRAQRTSLDRIEASSLTREALQKALRDGVVRAVRVTGMKGVQFEWAPRRRPASPNRNNDSSGGALKNMGRRNRLDEKALESLRRHHDGLEHTAATSERQEENVDGERVQVIETHLPNHLSAYHVSREDGPPLVILKPGLALEIRKEAIYHEVMEDHWKKKTNPKTGTFYTQHEAHILASAEQALEFVKDGLTPYHRAQIADMSASALRALLNETEGERQMHLDLIASAGLSRGLAATYEHAVRAEVERRYREIAVPASADQRFEIGTKWTSHGHQISGGASRGRLSDREIIVVDWDHDEALNDLYLKIVEQIDILKEAAPGPLSGEERSSVLHFVLWSVFKQVTPAEEEWEQYSKQYAGVAFPIGEAMMHGGVCRHMGILSAAILEKLIQDKKLNGQVFYVRGRGHAWAVYRTTGDEFVVFDLAQQPDRDTRDSRDVHLFTLKDRYLFGPYQSLAYGDHFPLEEIRRQMPLPPDDLDHTLPGLRVSEVPEGWLEETDRRDPTVIDLHPQKARVLPEDVNSTRDETEIEELTKEDGLAIDLMLYAMEKKSGSSGPEHEQFLDSLATTIGQVMEQLGLSVDQKVHLFQATSFIRGTSEADVEAFKASVNLILYWRRESLSRSSISFTMVSPEIALAEVDKHPLSSFFISGEIALAWDDTTISHRFTTSAIREAIVDGRVLGLQQEGRSDIHLIQLSRDQLREAIAVGRVLRGPKDGGTTMTMPWVYGLGDWLGFSKRGSEFLAIPVEAHILTLVMAIPGSWKWFAAFHPDRDPKDIHEGVKHARHVFATLFLLAASVVISFDLSLPVIHPANIMQWFFYVWGASILISGPGHLTWNAQHPDAAMTLGKAKKDADSLVMDARRDMRIPEILWAWVGLVANRTRAALSPTYRQGLIDKLESVEASLNQTLETKGLPSVALVAETDGFARFTKGQPSTIQVNVFLPARMKLRAAALVLARLQNPGVIDRAIIRTVAEDYVAARRDQMDQQPSTLHRIMGAVRAVGGRSGRMTDLVPVAESVASSPKDQAGLSQHLNPFRQAFLQSA